MAINKLRDIVERCYAGGGNWVSSFRKVPAIASTATGVVDFSMSPGNPKANFYTGDALTATLLNSSYGIWHGGNVYPATKILRKVDFMTPPSTITPIELYALDYIMFYPLIDMDSTDEQTLVNYGPVATSTEDPSAAQLTRYIDGAGVRAFLVATNPYVGGAQFTMTYINQDGVTKTTRPQTTNTHTYIGTIIHSGATADLSGTFINTPDGDGIRKVLSITFMSPNGGLAALVLCKVLSVFTTSNISPSKQEWDCLLMKSELPVIKDGAYLNFIGQVNGSAAAVMLSGTIETIWN
jgi:hypothetical protein